jgi:two-component system nitrogen regulation sensor histidine kinase NtrY
MTINPSGERILQVEAGEIEGKNAGELQRLGLGPLQKLFTGKEGPVGESEITIFSGERRRTLKAVVTSLVEGGEHLGTVVVFDDLTELIRSKKLAAWVEMARQIAHEVKNPLTPIRLSAQLMKRARESGREDFDEIFSSSVETVIQQTEILRKIASEFSSFGKASNLSLEEIRIDEFLEEFVSAYRGAEKVTIDLDVTGPVSCSVDREALRKILVNLLENALEAMQHEGRILLRTESRGGMLYISVIDSGSGIPSEIEERLFEPYFSTKTNGTGLGLAISQNLAREMDGEIRIRNRGGANGVEATLRLPLSRGDEHEV